MSFIDPPFQEADDSLTPPTGLPGYDSDGLKSASTTQFQEEQLLGRVAAILETQFPGRYSFVEKVSAGGQGTVFKYTHNSLRTEVAIKVMDVERLRTEVAAHMGHVDAAGQQELVDLCRRRLANEAYAGTFLHGLNIYPQVFDHYEGDPPFVIFRFYSGQTIEDYWKLARGQQSFVPLEAVVRAAAATAEALQVLHGAGVIHRDLKPANVLLEPSRTKKDQDRALLLDLGSAVFPKHDDIIETQTVFNAVPYTPAYAAPEKLAGDKAGMSPADDVYALGTMLYWALSGRFPFEDEARQQKESTGAETPVEQLMAQQRVQMREPTRVEVWRSDTPPSLAELVAKMLHYDAPQRPSAGQAAAILDALIPKLKTKQAIGTHPTTMMHGEELGADTVLPGRGGAPMPSRTKKKSINAILVVGLLLLLVGLGYGGYVGGYFSFVNSGTTDSGNGDTGTIEIARGELPLTEINEAAVDIPPVEEPAIDAAPVIDTDPPSPIDTTPPTEPLNPPHRDPPANGGGGGDDIASPNPGGKVPVLKSIKASPHPAILGQPVQFSAVTAGDVTSWRWYFGTDAVPQTSHAKSPQVTFPRSATYTVSLRVGNPVGEAPPQTLELFVAPTAAPPLIVTVKGPNSQGEGSEYTFYATIQGVGDTWEWEFDSGASLKTSKERKPRVTLSKAGKHTGRVRAGNAAGMSEWRLFTFEVDPPRANAQIVHVNIQGTRSGMTAIFQPTLTGDIARVEWSFGGGATPNSSTSSAPKVTLGKPGTYSFTLKVYDSEGRSQSFTETYEVIAAE